MGDNDAVMSSPRQVLHDSLESVRQRLPEVTDKLQAVKKDYDRCVIPDDDAHTQLRAALDAEQALNRSMDSAKWDLGGPLYDIGRLAGIGVRVWSARPSIDRAAHLEDQFQQFRMDVKRLREVVDVLMDRQRRTRNSDAFYQPTTPLLQLVSLLKDPRKPRNAIVHGNAGTGKSALAQRIKELWWEDTTLQDMYPDGPRLVQVGPTPDCTERPEDEKMKRSRVHMFYKLQELLEHIERELEQIPIVSVSLPMSNPVTEQDLVSNRQIVYEQSIEDLCLKIHRRLEGSKHIIILDSIWEEQVPLLLGERGICPRGDSFQGAIIVTSRHDHSARISSSCFRQVPMDLSRDREALEGILAGYASNQRNYRFKQNAEVGKQVLRKVTNPLALRLIGSAIHFQLTTWDTVLGDVDDIVCESRKPHQDASTRDAMVAYTLILKRVRKHTTDDVEGLNQLFAVLRLFAPMDRIPVNILRAVWCAFRSTGIEHICRLFCGYFDTHLKTLKDLKFIEDPEPLPPFRVVCITLHPTLLNALKDDSESSNLLENPVLQNLHNERLHTSSLMITAQCCVCLVGKHSARWTALEALRTVPLPEGSPCQQAFGQTWWHSFSELRLYSLNVAATLAAQQHFDESQHGALIQKLLFSAATGYLPEDVKDCIGDLLSHRYTALMALAVILGTKSHEDKVLWSVEHASAVRKLVAEVEGIGSSLSSDPQAVILALDAVLILQHAWQVLFHELKAYEEAALIAQAMVTVRERVLPENDMLVLDAWRYVARTMLGSGQQADAHRVFKKVFDIQQARMSSSVGMQHREWEGETYCTMADMSECLMSLNRCDQAMELVNASLEGWRRLFGDGDDFRTLTSMRIKAWVLFRDGKHEYALEMFKEVQGRSRRWYGEDHFVSALAKAEVGVGHGGMGSYIDALQEKQAVQKALQVKLGKDHANFLALRRSIAVAYTALGKHEEALVLDEQIHDALKQKGIFVEALRSRLDICLDYYNLSWEQRSPEAALAAVGKALFELNQVDIDASNTNIQIDGLKEGQDACCDRIKQLQQAACCQPSSSEDTRQRAGTARPSSYGNSGIEINSAYFHRMVDSVDDDEKRKWLGLGQQAPGSCVSAPDSRHIHKRVIQKTEYPLHTLSGDELRHGVLSDWSLACAVGLDSRSQNLAA